VSTSLMIVYFGEALLMSLRGSIPNSESKSLDDLHTSMQDTMTCPWMFNTSKIVAIPVSRSQQYHILCSLEYDERVFGDEIVGGESFHFVIAS